MQKLVPLMLVLSISSIAVAEVWTSVYLADGNTPLELADPNIPFAYRDIMVGTKLTIVVASDAAGGWDGGIYIEGTDRDYGVLSARDYNDVSRDWQGSCLEAAGQGASVQKVEDDIGSGFELIAPNSPAAGDWFVIDYTATNVGSCRVGIYEYPPSIEGPPGPIDIDKPIPPDQFDVIYYELVFNHVPTRDFDQDARVGLTDLAVFALYWGATDCTESSRCEGADLDADGDVDADDLGLFAHYWLETMQ